MDVFQNIKQDLSITRVLHYYNFRKGKSKNNYYCILHENTGEKHTPSLVASDTKGTATCLSKRCFDNDDIFGVIEKLEKCSKKEALYKAAKIAGISIDSLPGMVPKPSSTKKITEKHKRIKNLKDMDNPHIHWLEQRGIDFVTACNFGIKAADDCIAFPHWKMGEITGWKLRNIYDKSKTWQVAPEKGDVDLSAKLWYLGYWEDKRNFIDHLVFVEGEPDCLLLTQKFAEMHIYDTAVVTCTAGAKTIPPEIEVIKEYFPKLKKASIVYDHDSAGREGSKKLAEALRKHRISIHIYSFPLDSKEGYDITDFFQEGKSLFDLFSLQTKIIAPYYDMKPAIDTFDFMYTQSSSIKTGFSDLDDLTNGLSGLVVLGGETGTGKTTFMINMAYNAAKQEHPVLYVSYELGYTELRVKLAAMHSNYGYSLLNRDKQHFLKAREVLLDDPALDYFKVIDTSLLSLDIDYIEEGIAALKYEFPDSKIPLVVIDYLQGLPIVSGGEYRLALASVVQGLRDLVRQKNVVVLVASATNTQRKGSSSYHAGVFRESSEIEYSAYIALVLGYKEEQKDGDNIKESELRFPYLFVVKNRFGSKNTRGIPFVINWESQTYQQRENRHEI